jgi:hypothetical protein
MVLAVTLVFVIGAEAKAGTVAVSLFGGLPLTYAKYAVSSNAVEFVDTKLDDVSLLTGARLIWMFSNPSFIGVDVSARRYRMDLESGREDLGTVEITPVLVGVTFRKVRQDPGLAAHGGLAMGIGLNNLAKTAYLDSLEAIDPVDPTDPGLNVRVKTSFAMDFDFGLDYFLTRFLAVGAVVRFEGCSVPTDGWHGVEHLYIESSNFQFTLATTFWLRS